MRFTFRENSGKDLCQSCKEGHVITTARGVQKLCHYGVEVVRIHEPVTRCSRYRPENELTDWEAKQVGWVLEVDKKGRLMGFRPPTKGDREA